MTKFNRQFLVSLGMYVLFVLAGASCVLGLLWLGSQVGIWGEQLRIVSTCGRSPVLLAGKEFDCSLKLKESE